MKTSGLYIGEVPASIAGRCYQCGKCTAGCPVVSHMDLSPSKVVRMVQVHRQDAWDRLLSSRAIWLCVGCETCLSRCPQEVDIPHLMDCLRQDSLKTGKNHPDSRDIISFHSSFLDSIRYTGRLYEAGLVAAYKVRSGHLFQDLLLAPKLIFKGKLGFLPHRIRERGSIARIFAGTLKKKREPRS